MKAFLTFTFIFIYMFLFSYLGSVFEVPKNIYYILIGFPLFLGGVLFIHYLFERNDYGNS